MVKKKFNTLDLNSLAKDMLIVLIRKIGNKKNNKNNKTDWKNRLYDSFKLQRG